MILSLIVTMMMSMTARAQLILYFTDLEGSRARLEDLYAHSGGFLKGADGRYHLTDGVTLVYGGDAPDRYLGSMWIIEELNRHFDENPGRVFAIGGNRDINKMRLTNELSDRALRRPPLYADRVKPELVAAEASLPPDRARRMKFIFKQTMGAPHAFELWRRELALREHVLPERISDERVVESYLDHLKPDGAFTRLLERMVLGLRFGPNVIVHGGLTPENLGRPPIDQHFARLNSWYRAEIEAWKAGYLRWSGEGPRFGEDLIEYPMPKPGARSKPESLVTGRHVDDQNNLLPPESTVREVLIAQGVGRELTGHTPNGDTANIARDEEQTFESICGDNSYCAREDNATWIWLSGTNFETASVRGRVQVSPDVWTEVRADTTIGRPSLFGRRTTDGSRTLGRDPNGDLVISRMVNFKIENQIIDCAKGLAETTH